MARKWVSGSPKKQYGQEWVWDKKPEKGERGVVMGGRREPVHAAWWAETLLG